MINIFSIAETNIPILPLNFHLCLNYQHTTFREY